jgi:8-oxo-dGTP pyrophosphatase MutT (NUDIX family)
MKNIVMPNPTTSAQQPLVLKVGDKTDVRVQFAALPYRINEDDGTVQVCLVTSRGTKRWILPKGWPLHKITPAEGAAVEAWEEAGLRGVAFDHCLGVYVYSKPLPKKQVPILVLVYPIFVTRVKKDWPEKASRTRKWFDLDAAAGIVAEADLGSILRAFDPHMLHR